MVQTTIWTIPSEATTSLGGKPYHPTHQSGSMILDAYPMLLKCSISAAPRKNGMLHKSRLVPAHGQNTMLLLSIPKAGKELKLQTVIDVREKRQHCSRLYATTKPRYDMRSGGSPPFHHYHQYVRHIWTATHYTRRCAKNTLLIPTRNLHQQYPPTRGLQWTIIMAKVHDIHILGSDRVWGVGIPRRHLHILEDHWGAWNALEYMFGCLKWE